jgi:hypothetical protein
MKPVDVCKRSLLSGSAVSGRAQANERGLTAQSFTQGGDQRGRSWRDARREVVSDKLMKTTSGGDPTGSHVSTGPSSSSAAITFSTFLVIESFMTLKGSYMLGSGL